MSAINGKKNVRLRADEFLSLELFIIKNGIKTSIGLINLVKENDEIEFNFSRSSNFCEKGGIIFEDKFKI